MSASLVGSEMCIRDSGAPTPWTSPHMGSPTQQNGKERELVARRHEYILARPRGWWRWTAHRHHRENYPLMKAVYKSSPALNFVHRYPQKRGSYQRQRVSTCTCGWWHWAIPLFVAPPKLDWQPVPVRAVGRGIRGRATE
eukprot:5963750-Alexandrium_andersonii.AAC.1